MILQTRLPYTPWADPRMARLPGIQPLAFTDWLVVDEAYAGQMAERDRLIAEARDAVHALEPSALTAAQELLELVLGDLDGRDGFDVAGDAVTRPDGVTVALDRAAPLLTLGRLVQEDFCILHPGGQGEHVLTGAILCFPASWTLAEKFMRPLIRIHVPVTPYDADIAARVQRLFDGIRPGRVLWRANAHFYDDPTLFQPRPEAAPRTRAAGPAPFLRSERQCILRLPETGAAVFSIHTYMLRRTDLSAAQTAALEDHPIAYQEARR
ncbi:heme-dependent oxidative N-demethylase family protein [Actibacterium sp. D379-3]